MQAKQTECTEDEDYFLLLPLKTFQGRDVMGEDNDTHDPDPVLS